MITLWEVETGKVIRTLSGHTNEVIDLAFSPDGRRLASSNRTRIPESRLPETKIWDVEGGRELASFRVERRWGEQRLAFSPDGGRLAITLSRRTPSS